jgi:hypothetical protein
MSDTKDTLDKRFQERAVRLWREAGQPAGGPEAFLARAREEELLDIEGQDSFPASDPPSHTVVTGERRSD